jgi:hypothetical protein
VRADRRLVRRLIDLSLTVPTRSLVLKVVFRSPVALRSCLYSVILPVDIIHATILHQYRISKTERQYSMIGKIKLRSAKQGAVNPKQRLPPVVQRKINITQRYMHCRICETTGQSLRRMMDPRQKLGKENREFALCKTDRYR